jgi:hypothetical protein
LKKFFLVLTLILLAVAVGAGLFFLAWLLHWNAWIAALGPILFLLVPGLYFAGARLWAYREKKLYARNVLNQEPVVGPALVDADPFAEKWSQAKNRLSPAELAGLKRRPFFLALGDLALGDADSGPALGGSASFKGQALSDHGAFGRETALNLERVDFSFADGAVLIAIKDAPDPARETDLLAKAASLVLAESSEGLAGLILAPPVGLFAPDSGLGPIREAAARRRQILDLSLSLDSQFPVFILLTDLAASPGLAEGALALSQAGQSLGLGLSLAEPDPQRAAQAAAQSAVEWLSSLYSFAFRRELAERGPVAAGPILKSLATIKTLQRPLAAFLDQLARPGATLPGPLIKSLRLNPPADDAQGLPLNGALSPLLAEARPRGRPLARPLALPGTPRQRRVKIAALAYFGVCLVLCFSFWLNVRRHREFLAAIGPEPVRLAQPADDGPAASLDAAYGQSRRLERLNFAADRSFAPGLGPNRVGQAIAKAKEGFFQLFEAASHGLEEALARQMAAGQSPASRFLGLRQLMWLAEAYHLGLDGDFGGLEGQLAAFPAWPSDFQADSQPYWNLVYGELLVDYLKLNPPRQRPIKTLSGLELAILKSIPDSGAEGLGWLLDWAKSLPESRPVSLATGLDGDVFARLANRAQLAEVSAAYALKGREAIFLALGQLARVHRHPEAFGQRAATFVADYDRDYLAKWRAFGLAAAAAASRLNRPGELKVFVDNSLRLMGEHLAPYLAGEAAPPFVRNLELEIAQNRLHRQIRRTRAPAGGGIAGLLERADFLADDVLGLRELLEPSQRRDSDLIGRIMSGSQPYKDYHAALALAEKALGQPAEALAMARAHFGGPAHGDPTQSPFALAETALDRYLAFFYQGPDRASDDPVREMVKAHLKNLQNLLIRETAKTLDRQWEAEVLAPVRFLAEAEARQALYSPNGLLDKFLADRASPFLNQKGQIFRPAAWRGQEFPFHEDFLRLLTVGRLSMSPLEPIKDRYPVKLTALFASVNPEAKEKPQKTQITLKAADGAAVLENFNYPVSQVFEYRPGVSGDVEVEIFFPSLTLALSYQGREAFAYFLRDVATGELTLTRGDFPEDDETLASLGVDQIRLAVEAEGFLSVVKFVELAEAPKLPSSIVRLETSGE